MNTLGSIFEEIKKDFYKPEYKNEKILSRRFEFENGVIFIAYYCNFSKTREIAIKIPNDYDKKVLTRFPNWKGIDLAVCEIEYGIDKGSYILFRQLPDYDSYIYELVLEDLINNIETIVDIKYTIEIISRILGKWKQFFIMQSELVISDVRQQGLYGELVFLEKIIDIYGEKALEFWSGCNSETHDFYINGNAIEVKTTSTNSANKVIISNEHQLDNNDVSRKLYLMFIALRKSKSDGEIIPVIVERISKKILTEQLLRIFENKLFKYGYIFRHPEIYKIGFFIREVRYCKISADFPKLTKLGVSKGITNISYELNLDVCDNFLILEQKLINELKE